MSVAKRLIEEELERNDREAEGAADTQQTPKGSIDSTLVLVTIADEIRQIVAFPRTEQGLLDAHACFQGIARQMNMDCGTTLFSEEQIANGLNRQWLSDEPGSWLLELRFADGESTVQAAPPKEHEIAIITQGGIVTAVLTDMADRKIEVNVYDLDEPSFATADELQELARQKEEVEQKLSDLREIY